MMQQLQQLTRPRKLHLLQPRLKRLHQQNLHPPPRHLQLSSESKKHPCHPARVFFNMKCSNSISRKFANFVTQGILR